MSNLTSWDSFLEQTGKTYEEAVEILTSYKYLKKSDEEWSVKSFNSGYVVWSDEDNQVMITEDGMNEFMMCIQNGVDENNVVFSRRGSKYNTGLKIVQKLRRGY